MPQVFGGDSNHKIEAARGIATTSATAGQNCCTASSVGGDITIHCVKPASFACNRLKPCRNKRLSPNHSPIFHICTEASDLFRHLIRLFLTDEPDPISYAG